MEEKFELIHYVYSLLFSKNYNRTTNFGIQKKSNFDFNFATWKNKKSLKQNVKQTIQMQVQITAEGFSTVKNPANYRGRETEMNEQVPIDIRITDDIMALEEQLTRLTMVSVNENITDNSASKKRAEKIKYLEKQLSENTIRMKQMKKKTNKL